MTMTRLWTPNRPSFYMAPFGALVAACRPKMQQPSAFSPLDIAGLQLWLRADAGLYQDAAMTTPAVLDADPVGGWADQSLNNNHATQATAGSRPLLKLAIQNGKPVVWFDGIDDSLATAASILNAASTGSIIFVLRPTGLVLNIVVEQTSSSPSVENDASMAPRGYWDNSNGSSCPVLTADTAYILSLIAEAATHTLYENGLAGTGIAHAGTTSSTVLAIGGRAGFFFAGYIGELIIYNSALSAANRQAVEAYLNSRWGVY